MRSSILLSGLALSLVAALVPTLGRADDTPAPVAESGAAETGTVETGTVERGALFDVVELKDGRRLTGEIVGQNKEFVSIRSAGVLRAYARDRVASITRAERGRVGGDDGDRSGNGTDAPLPPPVTAPVSKTGPLSKKDARKAAKQGGKRRTATDAARPLSDAGRAWLQSLLERATSAEIGDPTVRASLAAAIQAMGPAAIADVVAAAAAAPSESRVMLERIARKMSAKAKKRSKSDRAGPRRPATDAATPADAPDRQRGAKPTDTGKKTDARGSARAALATLGLSREQGQGLRELLRDFGKARRETYTSARMSAGSGDLDRTAAREQIAGLRAELMTAVEALLDAEQYAGFEQVADDLLKGRARTDGKRRPKKGSKESPKTDAPTSGTRENTID